jgi:hypothetical protein
MSCEEVAIALERYLTTALKCSTVAKEATLLEGEGDVTATAPSLTEDASPLALAPADGVRGVASASLR